MEKNKKIILGVVIAIIAIFAIIIIIGSNASNDSIEYLKEVDTNKNGYIEGSELSIFLNNEGISYSDAMYLFNQFDLNKDGKWNNSELEAFLSDYTRYINESG